MLRKRAGTIGDDMKKSRPSLMVFLSIAAAFHFHFSFFPRVLLDQRELKGVLEDLDLQGKKFVLFLIDFKY